MAKIPTTNISWDVIRNTLNAAGGSVTNEISTGFVKGAYNKWARWKPTKYALDFLKALGSFASDHWMATDGCCGLKYPIMTNTSELASMGSQYSSWEADPPTGGTSAPMRIDDFGGYDSNARSILNNVAGGPWNGIVFIGQGENLFLLNVSFHDNRQGQGHDESIDVTDIKWLNRNKYLGDTYFGIIIRADSGNFVSYATMKWTLNELIEVVQNDDERYPNQLYSALQFTAPQEMMQTAAGTYAGQGNYSIYPALFFNRNISDYYGKTGDFQIDVDGFIPLPTSAIQFNALYYTSQIEVRISSAYLNEYNAYNSGHYIRVTVRITNTSNFFDFTFAQGLSNTIRVGARLYNPGNDYSYKDESTMSGEITVARGETKYYTAITPYIEGAVKGSSVEVRAIWTLGGTQIITSGLIDNISN